VGRLGIGTTSPNAKLDVTGSGTIVYAGGTASNNEIVIERTTSSPSKLQLQAFSSNPSIKFTANGNGRLRFLDSSDNERVTFLENGNVGIGTTNPTKKLDVAGAMNLALSPVALRVGGTAVLGILNNFTRVNGTGGASGGIVFTSNNDNNEKVRITGTGNVGIGTTSPSEKLEVDGTIKSNQVDVFAENIPSRIGRSTGQHLSLYGNPTGNYLIGVGNKNTIIGRSGQGRIVFRNDGIQFSTEATQTRSDLFIEVINGYVGVGTSSPSQKLEVAGNILVRGSNDSADGLHLKDRTFVAFSDASSVVSRFRSSAAGIFQFQDGSYNTNIVLNTNGNSYLNGGNVGIGTTTPGAKLSVNGNVKIEGTNSLLFGGSATVPIWAISSNGSDLLIDDQASNIGSVLFNNNEGVALPRLTTTQINAISSPAQGLMAYNTTLNTICFYNGSSWQKVNHANM